MGRSNVQKGGSQGEGSEARGVKTSLGETGDSPLRFDVEPAVPECANKPSRRLFIKLTWTTAAVSYVAPKIAHAGAGPGGLSPAEVPLPFRQEFAVEGLEGRIEGSPEVYEFSLNGTLDIDEAGAAAVTGLSMRGTPPAGGDVISIEQREDGGGTYADTQLDVRIPVLYSDGELEDVSAILRMQGTLTTAEGDVDISLTVDPDISVAIKGFIPPEP